MDRLDAVNEIKSRWRDIIPTMTVPAKSKVNHETSWVCPICGHGTHGDGLAVNIKSQDRNSLKCFGCNFSGDIISLMREVYKEDFNSSLKRGADILGITIENDYQQSSYRVPLKNKGNKDTAAIASNRFMSAAHEAVNKATRPTVEQQPTEKIDYTDYISKCVESLQSDKAAEGGRQYLAKRGISLSTARTYNIGYDDNWVSPTAIRRGYKPPSSRRVILPSCNSHYVSRAIDQSVDKKFQKMNEGAADVFNKQVILHEDAKEIFVTEGIFDALSIIETGATAIALNSTSNVDMLLRYLKQHRQQLPTRLIFLLALDDDDSGKAATESLRKGLDELNISYMPVNVTSSGCKDANESLVELGLAEYSDIISRAIAAAGMKPDNVSSYINSYMTGDIMKFRSVIKTGYEDLDRQSGGLYSGLYVIAAGTSLGKTTFSLQLADQVAASGTDVLFFSLEQSKLELVSKSIARTTAQNDFNTAVTSLSIRRGKLQPNVLQAAKQYQESVGDRLSVIEGNFDCNLEYICDYVKNYIKRSESSPVVIIDYLQILQPGKEGASTKEVVDTTITELKRLSRNLNITVFVISSLNRANYLMPVDYESLKESGNIEYTADVIWGLQLQCLKDSDVFDSDKKLKEKREIVKKAKAETPRKIELVCLKNRYGIANFSTLFDYFPANDLYINTGARENTVSSSSDKLSAWKNARKGV